MRRGRVQKRRRRKGDRRKEKAGRPQNRKKKWFIQGCVEIM